MRYACVAVCAVPAAMFALPAHAEPGDLLVSSRFSNNVLRYDRLTGAPKGVFASGHGLANPNGIAYGPDGHLYVGLGDTGRIMRFDGQSGAYIDDFVNTSEGGFSGCRAIAFGPDGDLFVAAANISSVLRFDGATRAFEGAFASGNGMDGTVGLTFAPDGDLYVGAALSNAVYRYDPTGELVRTYPGGTQRNTTGVLIDADGDLIAAYSVTNRIGRFDAETGATLRQFEVTSDLSIPIGMIFDPDGMLLVGSFGNDSVLRYDPATGAYLGPLVLTGSGGLDGTHNFAFIPVPAPSGLALLGLGGLASLRPTRLRRA